MRDLGLATYSTANDINNRGQVVGGYRSEPDVFTHAYRWQRGSVVDLDTLGTYQSEAFAVNDRGQAAGWALFPGADVLHAAFFSRGRMTDLGTIGGVAGQSDAAGVNDRGQVVGSYLDAAGKPQGFRLDDGVYTVIDTSAFPSAQLLGLNDRGEVVGGYLDPDGKVRGLLRDAKGTFTTFFAPQAGSQTGALDINDRRQIVGIYR